MKKQLSAAFLLAALTVSVSSCGETPNTPVETTTPPSAAETTAKETDIYDAVATPDFGGYEFRITNNKSNFAYQVIDIDKETGEVLDDAIFRRNTAVEEALNITITAEDLDWDVVIRNLKSEVMAGDDAHDIFIDETGQLLSNGIFNTYLADMKDVSTIHYENPWWNEGAMESVQIDDRRFFLYNDIDVMFYECYAVMLFNKHLAASYDMPDFYNLVDTGKWTLDVLKDCILEGAKDLNGDGKMDELDQYGIVYNSSCNPGFFVASDTHLITKDENGTPQWNGVTERMTDVYNKAVDCVFGNKEAVRTTGSKGVSALADGVHTLFHSGQSLFYIDPIGSVKKFRDVDFEVGLLPFPKYDEAQKDYGSYICYIAPALVVPTTAPDIERTGSILEVMAAYSAKYVRPAYFDTTLAFKYAHDEESQRMLDLILSKGEFELSMLYKWGSLGESVNQMLSNPTDKWASTLAKRDDRIRKDIDKTLNAES